jgi:hypothetical protein
MHTFRRLVRCNMDPTSVVVVRLIPSSSNPRFQRRTAPFRGVDSDRGSWRDLGFKTDDLGLVPTSPPRTLSATARLSAASRLNSIANFRGCKRSAINIPRRKV